MRGGRVFCVWTICVIAVLAVSCCTGVRSSQGNGTEELTVFAAASLAGAVHEIGENYEAKHPGIKIVTNFDGSQNLRTQIEQGAYADIFLSANTNQMDALLFQGHMVNDSISVFAKNRLAVILPLSNPAEIRNLSDLARPGTRLVIGTKEVPVGDYARQVLAKMANDSVYGPSYREAVLENVISEETTAGFIVSKIILGEADAGIAYYSDVHQGDRNRTRMVLIPEAYNVIGEYPAGILAQSRNKQAAAQFIAYLKGDDGKAVLARFGFSPD